MPISSLKACVGISNLNPEEKRILELKYAATPFGKMNTTDLLKHSKALLLRMHVITGWILPADEFLSILVDQFQKKLLESYPNVNTEEIEAAFRKNSSSVKDWGRSFNLGLLDQVIVPYLNERYELSRLEESIQKNITLLPIPKMTDQEIVDTAWDVWNVTRRLDYISENCYEVLTKHYLIVLSIEEKHKLMAAANMYLHSLEENSRDLFAYTDRKETQKRYAKKIAVANLFQEYKGRGITIVLP